MAKKVWILEGWISKEQMIEGLRKAEEARAKLPADSDLIEIADETVKAHRSMMQKNPDGYWLGYQGKSNYKEFCYCAKGTLRNMSKHIEKWRVLQAEISDNADMWLGYRNGVENEKVLRYLYATLKYA